MKTEHDKFTAELFGNKVGRPPKLHPKSNAQRTRECRARKNEQVEKAIKAASQLFEKTEVVFVASNINSDCSWCGLERLPCCGLCSVGQLGHKDQI
jgi:hypothetical protein